MPNPATSAAGAVGANTTNLPGLMDLAGKVNLFNIDQARAPYLAGLPNYQNMLDTSSGNITSLLHGEIPGDVRNLITQSAAERGVATGMPGSPNSNAALLRALGLTSLGLQQQGEQELTTAIGRTPVPQMFDVNRMMITPEDVQSAQFAANTAAAAPNPAAQAAEMQRLFQQQASAAANAGHIGGGVMFRPPYSAPTYTSGFPTFGNTGGIMDDTAYGALGPFDSPATNPSTYLPPGLGYGALQNYLDNGGFDEYGLEGYYPEYPGTIPGEELPLYEGGITDLEDYFG